MEFDKRPQDRFLQADQQPRLAVNIEVPYLNYGHARLNELNVKALKGWLHQFVQKHPLHHQKWANRLDTHILSDSMVDHLSTFQRHLDFMASSARFASPRASGKLVCSVPLTLRIHTDNECALEQLEQLEKTLRKLTLHPTPVALSSDETKAIAAFRNAVAREVLPAVLQTRQIYQGRINRAEGEIQAGLNTELPDAEMTTPHIKRLIQQAGQTYGGGRGKS